jgi:MFS transporter, ACS family, hexuronate transporter
MASSGLDLEQRRWWVVGLLFLASVLNYVDRQTLSILAITLQKTFGFGDVTYGHLLTAFLLAYTLAYILAGRFCDAVGATRSMIIFIGLWSFAELLPPFLHSAIQLGASRFVLGLGEAGIWVVAPKIVSELFPPSQRAFAIGLYTVGATIGATIAPPMITALAEHHGWPSVFFITGVAGLLWLLPWWALNRGLSSNVSKVYESAGSEHWSSLLKQRNLWLLLSARLLTDPVWYFYLFWFPKYLGQARHQSFSSVGHSVWIVYFAADVGTLAGGWFAGVFIRRGVEPLRARRIWMSCMACLLPLSPLMVLAASNTAVLGIAAVVVLAHMAWLVTLTALVLDVFPSERVGTAIGWIAAGSGLGGILFSEIAGRCIATVGYLPLFCVMGLLHPLALLLIWRIQGRPVAAMRAIPCEVTG